MTRFSETAQSVPCTGAQSRVVYMDPQLATEESICDLSTKIRCSSVGIFARFGPTHDCVLDEELFLEIVANLVRGHDEVVVDVRSTRRVGTVLPQTRMQYVTGQSLRGNKYRPRPDPMGRLERSSVEIRDV